MKKVWIILLIALLLVSCETADILSGEALPNNDWDLIEESAKDTQLNLYITDYNEALRSWLSGELYKVLELDYNIHLSIKVMSIDDIITTLVNERDTEVKSGVIDLLLIKDNEFSILSDKQLLYEDISNKIPNFNENLNALELDIYSEHGRDLEGYAVPFGRDQFVMMFDEDELETYPKSTEELLEFLRDNPKKFTYPNPLIDSTGGEFIRSVLYEIIGQDQMMKLFTMTDPNEILEVIKPGLEYLKVLDPYLLKEEGNYFETLQEIDALFLMGDLYFTMTSDFAYAEDGIDLELYPEGAKSFIFDSGSIQDTSYLAVPMNAANKTGAIVAMNSLLSVNLQVNKYAPKKFGNLPIFDLNLLAESDLELFSKTSVKRSTLRVEKLYENKHPELPVKVQSIINDLWYSYMNE